MKKRIAMISIFALVFAVLFALPAAASTYDVDVQISGTKDYSAAQDIVDIVNQERAAEGLDPLVLDTTLTEYAMQRAAEITLYYDHTRPDGSRFFAGLPDAYLYGGLGENIAAGYRSSTEVMNGWMNSEGHRNNILNDRYSSIGIGCFYQENGTRFWVQVFFSGSSSNPCSKTGQTQVSGVNIDFLFDTESIGLSISPMDDCGATILHKNASRQMTVKIRNEGFASHWTTLDASSYTLQSTDTSVFTANSAASTITGVNGGSADLYVNFGGVSSVRGVDVIADPKLSYEFDEDGDLIVSWTQDDDNCGVYYREEDDELWTFLSNSSYSTSYTLWSSMLNPNDKYTFVMRYYDNDQWYEVSNKLVVRVPGPLEAPEVTVSNVTSTGKIKLTWKAVDGAAKYEIYRATSKNGTYAKMSPTTKTSYTSNSITPGKKYYYKVRAIAEDGTASEYSDIVSRTCKPARPTVTASNVTSTGKIKLTWKAVDGAVKYEIYRSTSKNGTYYKMTPTTKTSYSSNSITPGKTYYYKVRAVTSNGTVSAYSTVVSCVCKLARPDVTIKLSGGKPKLTWDAVDGAVKYEIYRSTSKNGTYSKLSPTTKPTYSNPSAKAGTTYYYKVRAVHSKSAANSAYSSVVYIKSK